MSNDFEMEDDGGMGLDAFLNYDPDRERGGGGTWLKPWKKGGAIDVWLHTESKIRPVWGHQFIIDAEVDEKSDRGEKTGRKVNKLLWPRFVSPDGAAIHANQYFREGAQLRETFNKDRNGKPTGYMLDPFLILREYLWHAIDRKLLDLEAVVFEWVDHKNRGELIQWTAGELSRQVKRGFKNRGHSLDTKLEYIFVVIDNARPGDGPRITRETKLLGDNMRAEIKRQIESKGADEGDPFRTPYCFRWKFIQDAPTPMKSYEAFRVDKNACTDEIWQAIGGAPGDGETWEQVTSPDTSEFARVNDGDMDKIRQAFESAAQIDLPLEAIFSEDWETRRRVVTGAILSASPAPSSTSSSRTAGTSAPATRPNPGAAPGAARQTAPSTTTGATRPATTSAATAPAASAPASTGGPQPRRKKTVEAPAAAPPPKEPEVERIKCDDCPHMMLPTDSKCGGCGAEYDVSNDQPAPEPVKAAPAASSSSTGAAKRPATRTAAEQGEIEKRAITKCIACGSTKLEKVAQEDGTAILRCGNCGADQGDDIPF